MRVDSASSRRRSRNARATRGTARAAPARRPHRAARRAPAAARGTGCPSRRRARTRLPKKRMRQRGMIHVRSPPVVGEQADLVDHLAVVDLDQDVERALRTQDEVGAQRRAGAQREPQPGPGLRSQPRARVRRHGATGRGAEPRNTIAVAAKTTSPVRAIRGPIARARSGSPRPGPRRLSRPKRLLATPPSTRHSARDLPQRKRKRDLRRRVRAHAIHEPVGAEPDELDARPRRRSERERLRPVIALRDRGALRRALPGAALDVQIDRDEQRQGEPAGDREPPRAARRLLEEPPEPERRDHAEREECELEKARRRALRAPDGQLAQQRPRIEQAQRRLERKPQERPPSTSRPSRCALRAIPTTIHRSAKGPDVEGVLPPASAVCERDSVVAKSGCWPRADQRREEQPERKPLDARGRRIVRELREHRHQLRRREPAVAANSVARRTIGKTSRAPAPPTAPRSPRGRAPAR